MKHNVFLGSGSGSIGDVVSYRREGTQVSRMRVREIKNPRTYNQAEQRNFLAPVSKFYAPLAGALEQSFEGKSTAKSYAAFSSEAVKKARLNGWYLPKGTGFFPLPYQVSQGTIQPIANISIGEDTGDIAFRLSSVRPTGATGSTVGSFSKWLIASGYKEGDQITIIQVVEAGSDEYYPTYSRFFLNSESTDALADVAGVTLKDSSAESQVVYLTPITGTVGATIIVSRYEDEKWRRSTQSLALLEGFEERFTSEEAKANAIASYMNGEYVPVSEIYLNGSTSQQ